MEKWKTIKGFENLYEVSDRGRVRSLDRVSSRKGPKREFTQRIKGQVLKPSLDRKGYIRAGLYKDRKVYNCQVHRLVAKAFIRNSNRHRKQVNHLDGNPANNKVSNLEWCTGFENMQHAKARGSFATPWNKGNKLQVDCICATCSNPFKRKKSKAKTKKVYCSRVCVGKANGKKTCKKNAGKRDKVTGQFLGALHSIKKGEKNG